MSTENLIRLIMLLDKIGFSQNEIVIALMYIEEGEPIGQSLFQALMEMRTEHEELE